jgi:molybdenum-dependent DNA-binding transcriptional regulator ModE
MSQELSLREAARAIQVPYNSVWYWHRLGKLPVRKIAGRNLIEPQSLRRALTNLGYRPKSRGSRAKEVA